MPQVKKPDTVGLYILSHPMRRAIVRLLLAGPQNLDALAKSLKTEEHLASFHLDTLEEHGFVTRTTWAQANSKHPLRAVPVYSLTPKVRESAQALLNELGDK